MSAKENVIEKKKNMFQRIIDRIFSPKAPMPSRKVLPFNAFDFIVMVGVSVFYAVIAFQNLGEKVAPQTYERIEKSEAVELSVSGDNYIGYICWCYLGASAETFKLELRDDDSSEWEEIEVVNTNAFGCWNGYVLPHPAKQVRFSYENTDMLVREIVLLDLGGYTILPNEFALYGKLFDEQEVVPDEISYMSSFYFDEILYASTAYQYINGWISYENTHPPLGKIIIALGITLFNYTPFGIRFMGTLFGVLMLPCLYLLARNITRDRGVSAFVMFIFAFDFMHFTQTRLATIDVFITFFIILMYYFMERYLRLSFYDVSLGKTWIPLGCCGIFFGFGVATKWTGFYAGAGLAILFFARLITYYREYCYALQMPDEESNGVSHRCIVERFKKNTFKTIVFCLVFFIAIPFGIYLASYIPFEDANYSGLWTKMIENQKFMFGYHKGADFAHEYISRWYEWPLMIRPMRYYAANPGGIARQGISALGNPLVWWAGIPAFAFTLYMAIRKKEKEAGFLCVGYLAQYVPWMFISRPTFIYHYFTSVPFVSLMIGYCFLKLKDKALEKKVLDKKSFYCLLVIYGAAVFGLFQLFYPVISGETISFFYVEKYLKWFKEWDFIIK